MLRRLYVAAYSNLGQHSKQSAQVAPIAIQDMSPVPVPYVIQFGFNALAV